VGAFMIPVWVSEPPQNNSNTYYGIGIADGIDAKAIEKARLKAKRDLASRLYLTFTNTLTENRQTIQKNTFFGKVRDTQDSGERTDMVSSLSNISGITDSKLEVSQSLKMTFCLVQLDKKTLNLQLRNKLNVALEEIHTSKIPFKLEDLKRDINNATNLGLYTFFYGIKYNSYKSNKNLIYYVFFRDPKEVIEEDLCY
jgi:hypothetical protein